MRQYAEVVEELREELSDYLAAVRSEASASAGLALEHSLGVLEARLAWARRAARELAVAEDHATL